MALNSANFKSNNGRDIKYLSKDFASFRKNLIEYSKTYFPKTYSDFNEASPGMMFIEMASYLGDILSYYTDDSLKESLMLYAEDKQNVIALACYLGYKPKVTSPSIVQIAVYQLAPAIGAGEDNRPDSDYFLRIKEGMVVEAAKSNVQFRTTELVDFNDSTDREITVYTDANGEATQYLIKKYVNAISAVLKTVTQTFTSPKQFSKINIADKNVIDIFDIRDSNGGKWYEVPYLAQEMVYVDYPVDEQTDKDLAQFKDSVSNILKVLKTSKRFVTKINQDNTTTIVFGGGNSSNDEVLIPNTKNVGLGLNSSIDKMSSAFDPANFLRTSSYGQSPSNTKLTISYLVGGGVSSNVAKGELTNIKRIEFDDDVKTFAQNETVLYNKMKSSVAVDNQTPATGGRGEETIDEIRENALANFGSQGRAVTRKDYQVRALALPAKYGGIAKAYCSPDGQLDNNSPGSLLKDTDSIEELVGLVNTVKDKNLSDQETREEVQKLLKGKMGSPGEKNNPFAINLYILGYNANNNLSVLNRAVKENLKTYIGEYRMLTDGINIIDGYVINIGLDFEVRAYSGYNKREVLAKCITELKDYFKIDNWTFNMPINISAIEILLAGIEGVQSVPKCEVVNKCLGSYSTHSYNISEATKGKMVYPSVDPCVFEVKFPNKDLKGRVL
jgi:hypothetical protein|tara:strand:- start:4258 stop:6270 length:2013 start_codon:yes stop_codon:yes gene_type:complete